MQPGEAGICEMASLCRGIPVEDGGACHIAADETHAGAVLEVDRREQDHGADRAVFEELVIVVTRHDPVFDPGIDGMGAPAGVAQALVESDRGPLRVAKIEVENRQTELTGKVLDLEHDATADAAAARPGRDECTRHGAGEGLRLIVARRPAELRRAGDDAVETAGNEPAVGNEQHALPIILQHLPRRRLQPAEPAALGDGTLRRLAEIVEIGSRIPGHPFDRDRRR